MRIVWTTALWLGGCSVDPEPATLVLDGPARIVVDRLGPVPGPRARLATGEEVAEVVWTVTPESVGHNRQGEIHAIGEGEATVRGEWQGQTVEWTLVVEPVVALSFDAPPATVPVGADVPLTLAARAGDEPAPPGEVTWTSSDETLATVDPSGRVRGVAPGVVYITAANRRAQAMVELNVVPVE